MSTDKQPINITFRISDIITKKFGLFPVEPSSVPLITDYQFTVKTVSNIDEMSKTISIINYVDVFLNKEQKNKIIELETEIIYEIKNFDVLIQKKEEEITIPESVIKSFIGIAISTVRGILFTRTENSQYPKVLLPPLNVSSFISKKIEKKEI